MRERERAQGERRGEEGKKERENIKNGYYR